MNDEQKRAWRDAREDYLIEQAKLRTWAYRMFVTLTLLGLGWKFFYVLICDLEPENDPVE